MVSEFDQRNDLCPISLTYTDIQGVIIEVTIGKWNFKIDSKPMPEEREKNFIFDVANGQYRKYSLLWKQEAITRTMHITLKENKYILYGLGDPINLVSTIHPQKLHAYNFFMNLLKLMLLDILGIQWCSSFSFERSRRNNF